jgi:hypothetical protein
MVTRRAAITASLILAVGLSAAATAAPVAGATRKVALGVQMQQPTITTFNQFKASVGRAPASWTLHRIWSARNNRLDLTELRALKRGGTTPLVWWMPENPNNTETLFRYSRILSGEFDSYITDFARDAKAFGGRMIIRFAHEMDGDWFPWRVRYPNTRKQFVNAWRRIVTIFREVGATNVKWLWSPNGCGKCPTGFPTLRSLYPGDRYVDYLGMSAFNWGLPTDSWELATRSWQRWTPMAKLLRRQYGTLTALAPSKKVIVAELASSTDAPASTTKAAWVRDGYRASWQAYPKIALIVYFNVDLGDGYGNPHEHWSLTAPNTTPRSAYKRLLRDVRFQGRI